MSDQQSQKSLIRACRKGNRKAQFELYKQHRVKLFGICLRYAKSVTEAEDMLQEGFYKILRDVRQYNSSSPFEAWMRKVIVNSALMHIRKFHKLKFESIHQEYNDFPSQRDNSLMEQDRANAIILLIQRLPVTQQTVFNLRAIEGYSFNEISQQLEVNEATLRSQYSRARKQLQIMLQKEMENG